MTSGFQNTSFLQRHRDSLGAGVVLAALWIPVLWRLRIAWSLDPELGHGWAVPFLALYLAWQRASEGGRASGPFRSSESRLGLICTAVGAMGVAASLPILEVNPLWPTVQWAGALMAGVGTLGVLLTNGGWTAARCMAFPLAFVFTALAWPAMVRAPLVLALTRAHAQVAAEIVSLTGFPAVVEGNVIRVAHGVIGVEEACSGLRSLQAVWMLGWFFGEWHRLRVIGRLRVVGVAVAAATVGNVVRTVFLTWQVGRSGGVTDFVHDSAGLLVLGFTLAVVYVYASAEARWVAGLSLSKAVPPTAAVGTPMAPVARLAVWLMGLGAIGFAEVGTAYWYRRGTFDARAIHWTLHQPSGGQWSWQPVEAFVTDLLMSSSAEKLVAPPTRETGAAVAFVFRWEQDKYALNLTTDAHDPTICMPNVGGRLQRRLPPTTVTVAGRDIVFDGYRFVTQGRPLVVFNAVWDVYDQRAVPFGSRRESITALRLRRVAYGRMRGDADRLVLALQQDVSDEAAAAWLREEAPQLLRPLGNE